MTEEQTYRSLRDTSIHLYSVSEICALTGVTRKTLFYYDRTGLLKPVCRTGSQNFKQYDAEALMRLRMILRYREAGLHLSEISAILDDPGCDRVMVLNRAMERMQQECSQTNDQIIRLQAMIGRIQGGQ
ncbi:MAG: MerR family transcriptional regulator [Solobacterium sp.]|nr:MerR family transcriptional regulator [Solobacterium sp.]